ncbi:hypothetical protein V6Z12_A10G116000 [Gossypium hirsutum]
MFFSVPLPLFIFFLFAIFFLCKQVNCGFWSFTPLSFLSSSKTGVQLWILDAGFNTQKCQTASAD